MRGVVLIPVIAAAVEHHDEIAVGILRAVRRCQIEEELANPGAGRGRGPEMTLEEVGKPQRFPIATLALFFIRILEESVRV